MLESARLALFSLGMCLVIYTAGRISSDLLTAFVTWIIERIWPDPPGDA